MSTPSREPQPSRRSLIGLDAFNVVLADLETGISAYLAVFLANVRHFGPGEIGLAIGAGSFASVVVQVPMGALIDRTRHKRLVVALAGLIGAAAAIVLAVAPSLALVASMQVVMAAAFAVFPPALGALSLGIVGRDALPERQGRNQAFNGIGNVAFAIVQAVVARFISLTATIFSVAGIGVLTALSMLGIRESDIDHERARESGEGDAATFATLIRDRRIATFTLVVFLFFLSNEAMLVLFGQLLPRGGNGPSLYLSLAITLAQLVLIAVSVTAGRNAKRLGRKPVFAIAIAALVVRGIAFGLATHAPNALVAIEALDGLAAGVYDVVWVLIAADVARGTGRFNVTLGIFAAAQGIGATCSNALAGFLAARTGFEATFFVLAAIAAAALALFLVAMPETRDAQPEGYATESA
ncbi:MAG: MFS transporter [Candidatus Eremiobacteraeota bacterium]|nr:MFS transporter [Candidatus Eremiobacteraeota bacterium]